MVSGINFSFVIFSEHLVDICVFDVSPCQLLWRVALTDGKRHGYKDGKLVSRCKKWVREAVARFVKSQDNEPEARGTHWGYRGSLYRRSQCPR